MLSAVQVGAAAVGASDESPPLAFFELLFHKCYRPLSAPNGAVETLMAESAPCPTRKKRVWEATVGRMISHSSLIIHSSLIMKCCLATWADQLGDSDPALTIGARRAASFGAAAF
jgi:hypothetical protein